MKEGKDINKWFTFLKKLCVKTMILFKKCEGQTCFSIAAEIVWLI